jgi:basic amino acid/polyamine antiporter, APA family
VMSKPDDHEDAPLQRTITPLQFVAIGFGGMVGSGWAVLLGSWLGRAGPGGGLIGITAGGVAMALIAAFYAELGSRIPQTGGDVAYITAVYGRRLGFVVGWSLTLAFLSVTVFEGAVLIWLLELLWSPIASPVLYVIFGQSIGFGGLLVALASALVIAACNYRGARALVRFQSLLTSGFVLLIILIVGIELSFGSLQNIRPIWGTGTGAPWFIGAVWVFATAPYIFGGFQGILQGIEERSWSTSNETVVRLVLVAIAAAAVFYWLIVIGAAIAEPWKVVASSDFPAIAALAHLPWFKALSAGLLIALIASVLKTWNAMFMISTRLILAQASAGMIPAFFGRINKKTRAPGVAVVVAAIFNLVGLFLGKAVIEPVVSLVSVSMALCYALCCAAALTLRRRCPEHSGFRVPGGTPVGLLAVGFALAISVLASMLPAPSSAANTLKWAILAIWAVVGIGLYNKRNIGTSVDQPAKPRMGAEN